MIIDIGAGNNNVNFHKGGGAAVKVEDNKQVTYTANGTFEIAPSDGYDAIKGAEVKVEVSEPSTIIDLSTGVKFGKSSFTTCPYHIKGASGNNMTSLFSECGNLLKINLSTIVTDTSNVTSFASLFSNCYFLSDVQFGEINTLSLANISNMFQRCSLLKNVDWGTFDFTNVKNANYLFANCENIVKIDMSQANMANLESMTYFVSGCYSLKELVLSSKFFSSSALTTYDFSGATAWTEETSLATLVDALPQLTSSKTIKLSTATKNALTDEQKTTITDKGWTIA